MSEHHQDQADVVPPLPYRLLPTLQLSPALSQGEPEGTWDGPPEKSPYHAALFDGVANIERALNKLASYYDFFNLESSVALDHSLENKRETYQWAKPDLFPPHIASVPPSQFFDRFTLFDFDALVQTLSTIFSRGVPWWLRYLAPDGIKTMQEIIDMNNRLHSGDRHDMYQAVNIGGREDWYTDAVFAQQHLTGPNSTTIKLVKATDGRFKLYKDLALAQQNTPIIRTLNEDGAFYIQDYSDFRGALKIASDAELVSDDGKRYGCAASCLFKMFPSGVLHPLGIIIDHRGSEPRNWPMLFNRRITPDDSVVEQKSDWPWRYAKMCVLTSDWLRHEVTVHLTETHLLEEALIVAAQRTLPNKHLILRLLERTWKKTLSLNTLARSTLVPDVIKPIVGFPSSAIRHFISKAYHDFDWTGRYVPNDLNNRGFPPHRLNEPMFHNAGYARCINDVWITLRKFVKGALAKEYGNDHKVANDSGLQAFCSEMRAADGGQLGSFPVSLKTVDELVDVVTMIMHIASPQHTAVNYLQQYYQVFIPNKPSALFSQLPASTEKLKEYNEQDVLGALPINAPREWLLMAQLPYLLSFKVAAAENLFSYANWASYIPDISTAGATLWSDLNTLSKTFAKYNEELDDKVTGYTVLDPEKTAESILI